MKVNQGSQQNWLANNDLVRLKNEDWLVKQRIAGKVAAGALLLLEQEVKNGTTKSLLELDKLAEEFIRDNDCEPTFLHYKGFPNSICISINQQLVHGICTNYYLQDGDMVSFDLGSTYKSAISDTAITCLFGEPKNTRHIELIQSTQEALMKGIAAIKVGNQLGCIGEAISKYAKSKGFGNVVKYGGHGLDWKIPHASPFVSNEGVSNKGIRMTPGLTLAIEPMLTIGSTETYLDQDKWTVNCRAEMSCHFEHTIYLHEDHVEIITDRSEL